MRVVSLTVYSCFAFSTFSFNLAACTPLAFECVTWSTFHTRQQRTKQPSNQATKRARERFLWLERARTFKLTIALSGVVPDACTCPGVVQLECAWCS